jgi:hypothetical protein
MQQHLYPDDWKQRVQEADLRAGGRCEGCGAVLGTMRVSRKGNLYFLPLHTSHVNHDPENPHAELRKLCPSCHGKTHPWLPGTPTKERPYGYQAITLSRVLQAARSGGLDILPDESGAGVCWRIGDLAGNAVDVLDAVTSALHCLRMERLERASEGSRHG